MVNLQEFKKIEEINLFLEEENYNPFPKSGSRIFGNYKFTTLQDPNLKNIDNFFIIQYLGNKKTENFIRSYNNNLHYINRNSQIVMNFLNSNKNSFTVTYYDLQYDYYISIIKSNGIGYIAEISELINLISNDKLLFNKLKKENSSSLKNIKKKKEEIFYSFVINEVYKDLVNLRDRCNIMIEGIKLGAYNYTENDYKAFSKSINKIVSGNIKINGKNNSKLQSFANKHHLYKLRTFLRYFSKKN